jgi:hypothetical protein
MNNMIYESVSVRDIISDELSKTPTFHAHILQFITTLVQHGIY